MSGPTIGDIVREHYDNPATPPPEALIERLLERERSIGDMLRMAGMQFGLFPQIVAEVLAEVELGGPLPEDQRLMIRQQFLALMEEVRRAQEGGGDMPTPG